MYVPQNITLIVNGRSLDPTKLLNTLTEKVVPSIAAHQQAKGRRPEGWVRPFVESSTASNPPVLKEDRTEIVDFPERDESVGELMVTWLGVAHNDFLNDLALEVLGTYLTDSAVSPLAKEFVEIDEPACTGTHIPIPPMCSHTLNLPAPTDIAFYASSDHPTTICAYLSSVPVEELDTLSDRLKKTLRRIADEGIDMSRMQSVLERQKLQLLESMETDASEVICNAVVAGACRAWQEATQSRD